MNVPLTRREVLAGTCLAAAAAASGAPSTEAPSAAARAQGEPFGYCLNTGTIRGHGLGLDKEVELAAEAGYGAIEPWIGSIQQYRQSGGLLKDLGKRIADLGLKVPSAIGFAAWLVDDPARRAKGLEDAKGDMDLVRQIGGTGIAAPPAGATGKADLDVLLAAQRYRALLELGDRMGVVPQLEIWGSSRALHRLGEVAAVAVEAAHPNACLLLDVFHVYKGGSSFAGLGMLGPRAMRVFHVNDYPADPPRERINDGYRVYPGDGVAPLGDILRTLKAVGFTGWLSLELFNREYYKQPAAEVAKTGLAKMKAAVRKALG